MADRLEAHAKELLALEEPFVLAGDYNIIPEPIDARHRQPGRTTRSSSPSRAGPGDGCLPSA